MLTIPSVSAQASIISSANYTIPASVVASGGGDTVSATYSNHGVIGQLATHDFGSSPSYLSESGYINILIATLDPDRDGFFNPDDDFPNDSAASLDSDGDGFPDSWNEGKTQGNSTTNLTLDACPANKPIRVGDIDYWNGGLQAVYDDPDVESFAKIKVQSSFVNGQLELDLAKEITIQGGFDCQFTNNNEAATVIDSLIIAPPAGSVYLDNIAIE